MVNLIELEHFGYEKDVKDRRSIDWYVMHGKIGYACINPAQITSITDYYCNSKYNNNITVEGRVIVMSSREAFITDLTKDELLEKINGKPKK